MITKNSTIEVPRSGNRQRFRRSFSKRKKIKVDPLAREGLLTLMKVMHKNPVYAAFIKEMGEKPLDCA